MQHTAGVRVHLCAIASNIRDVSLKGVFLTVDASGAQEGDTEEVVIDFSDKDQQIEHRVPAVIARIHPEGVGLKFTEYDDQTDTDLVNFLYAN